jgi:hypothetical protein
MAICFAPLNKPLFDVLLTTDTSLPHPQNLEGRKIAVVILGRNRWSLVLPLIGQNCCVDERCQTGNIHGDPNPRKNRLDTASQQELGMAIFLKQRMAR